MSEKLSVTIIVKNEESNLKRCLLSVSWADEIILVDTGSTDNTLNIARKFGCQIYNENWLGFGKTKRLAVDNAKNNWILSIDADEEVTAELKKTLEICLANPANKSYKIRRKSFYLGKAIKFCGWGTDYPLRFFNRLNGNFNEREVHESVEVKGEVDVIEEYMLHHTYPDIKSHLEKINRYSDLAASKLIRNGKQYNLLVSLLLGIIKFIRMYILKLGFLDGTTGLILCINSAFGVYLKYIKTWRRVI